MKVCPYCAEEIQDLAVVCKHCKRDLPSGQTKPISTQPALDFSGETAYYRTKFQAFESVGRGFTATWNWAAFLFGPLWYLSKSLWAKSGIMFLIVIFTGGVAGPLCWIYSGVAGNYDYYLLRVRGTQLWK